MIQKLILYLCQGHICSEYTPWLINHTKQVTHNQTFDMQEDWTEYSSSFGHAWEPRESHWTLDDLARRHYKQCRSDIFDNRFFDQLLNTPDASGTRCVYFNLQVHQYHNWVQDCKRYFFKHHPFTKLVLCGQAIDLQKMRHPSMRFLKEGIYLKVTRDQLLSDPRIAQAVIGKQINASRSILNRYKELEFDHVFFTHEILENPRYVMKKLGLDVDDNFDDLVEAYKQRNPPDLELDYYIHNNI